MTITLPTTGSGITSWEGATYAPWGHRDTDSARRSPFDWIITILRSETSSTFTEGLVVETVKPELPAKVRDVSVLVAELKTDSGLTADQLGRLLGVSRRSVHNWAAGATITPAREERVRALSDLVFSLPSKTPEERRARLLDSSAGPSLFRQFVEDDSRSERIKYSVPVEERFGL